MALDVARRGEPAAAGTLLLCPLSDSSAAELIPDEPSLLPRDAQPLLQPTLVRALQFIDDNFEERLRLAHVAHAAGLSPCHFSRVFKRRLGMSYVRYVATVRIRRAKRLLLTTARSVTDICYEVGFNDLSHFERIFHRLTGISPSEYRRLAESVSG